MLIGENGSGKSSLLRIIANLLKPKSGDLIFHHPSDFSMTYTWDDSVISNFKEHNSGAWILPPVENQLVMFPSWLQHSVEDNLSDEERISIAFNLDFNQNI